MTGAASQREVFCRGVRGAIAEVENSREAIVAASERLLRTLLQRNAIANHEIASIFFTATPDLDAAFPAQGARALGLEHVALLSAQEIGVANAVARCIRVLVHWNTAKGAEEIVHAYLGEAARLRPDRADEAGGNDD